MSQLDRVRRILGSRVVFENRWLKVREKVLEIGKRPADNYYVIEGSERLVSMLGVDNDRNVMLVEQYRFAPDEVSVDIPGGSIDPHESPEQAARREFEEETGFVAAQVEELGCILCDSGQKDSRRWLFLGRDISPSQRKLDCDETLRVLRLPLPQVFADVLAGKVCEPNLIVSLSLAAKRLGLL